MSSVMYNPESYHQAVATRLDHTALGHWLPYQQEITSGSYIPVPGTAFEDPHQRIFTGCPPEQKKSFNSFKRGPTTRSKSSSTSSNRPKPPPTKKLRKSENQLDVLRNYFKTNPKPGRDSCTQLAEATGLKFPEVRNWFRNARLRNKDGIAGAPMFSTKMQDKGDGVCEVSSSTRVSSPVDKCGEILQMWKELDDHEKQQLLPKYFSSWEKDGTERTEAIKVVLKCLTTTERNFVQSYVKPRGPYRRSSDKNLSKTTILERAKNAWRELERMFGANKREKQPANNYQDSLSLNLDKDMLEGLKSLFQAHRDYLYVLVKEMGIDTSDEKEMSKLKTSSAVLPTQQPRYPSYGSAMTAAPHEEPSEPPMDLAVPQYGSHGTSGHMDQMLSHYPPHILSHSYGQPTNAGYPILPTQPTPLYPGSSDFIPYPYHVQPYSSSAPAVPVGGYVPPTSPFDRSTWVPSLTEERPIKQFYQPEHSASDQYSFVKNHFTVDKLLNSHPSETKALKTFPDMGSQGLSAFNYNNMSSTTSEDHAGGSTQEITQKCTFVKYFEVTSKTFNKSEFHSCTKDLCNSGRSYYGLSSLLICTSIFLAHWLN